MDYYFLKGQAWNSNPYMAFLNFDKALSLAEEPNLANYQQAKDTAYNSWKKYETFVNEKESFISSSHSNFGVLQELINRSYKTGDLEGTIKYSNMLEEEMPETWVAYCLKYSTLMFLAKQNEAMLVLEKCHEVDETVGSTSYFSDKIFVLYSLGKYNEVIEHFDEWIERFGLNNIIEAGLSLSFIQNAMVTAMSYEKLGKNIDSEFWYEQTNLFPLQEKDCLKGNYLFRMGLYDEVVRMMESNDIIKKCIEKAGVQQHLIVDAIRPYIISKDIISDEYYPPIQRTSLEINPQKEQEIDTSPVCGVGTILKDGFCVPERETMTTEMQQKPSNGGGCLIATATFGSELAPQVQQLREIRDNSLLQTESGSAFMESFNQFYYSFSPNIADLERENPIFKEVVKLTITPLLSSLSLLNYVDMDSESEVLGYGIILILLNVGMYFVLPAIVIHRIRKFV